jgi:hypothetical protein
MIILALICTRVGLHLFEMYPFAGFISFTSSLKHTLGVASFSSFCLFVSYPLKCTLHAFLVLLNHTIINQPTMYSAKFCDILNCLRLKCLQFTDDFACANNADPIIFCISSRFLRNRKQTLSFVSSATGF